MKGQATLSLVFLIGGIAVLVGITLAFLVLSFINATYGFQNAETALAAASAGAYDGLLQLVRNKDFAAGTPYTVNVGTQTASVTVTQGAPLAGQARIVSTTTVGNRKRVIEAVVTVNSQTGQVSLVSWQLTL